MTRHASFSPVSSWAQLLSHTADTAVRLGATNIKKYRSTFQERFYVRANQCAQTDVLACRRSKQRLARATPGTGCHVSVRSAACVLPFSRKPVPKESPS